MSKRPSILIVACDPYLAGIYGRKFELEGWDVEIAEDLSEGEKKATRFQPLVILLDADCSADISQEFQRYRSWPTLQQTKIVILASAADRLEVQKALEAGASDYLLLGHFVPQEAISKMKKMIEE